MITDGSFSTTYKAIIKTTNLNIIIKKITQGENLS